jgi:hypothetical protein
VKGSFDNIVIHESTTTDELEVSVIIGTDDERCPSGTITVVIPKSDAPLSELKKQAIDVAFEFLKAATASRPPKNLLTIARKPPS